MTPKSLPLVAVLLVAGCLGDAPLSNAEETSFVATRAHRLEGSSGFAAEPHLAARHGVDGAVVAVANIEYHDDASATMDRTFWITVHRSMDGGGTWTSAPVPRNVLTPFDPSEAYGAMGDPVLAYGPDGTLWLGGVAAHAVWKRDGDRNLVTQLSMLTAFVTRSEDDGATWSPAVFHHRSLGTFGTPVLVAGTLADRPWLAISPENVIHFAWAEFVETQTALRHVRSTDDGASWSVPALLHAAGPGRLVTGLTLAAPGGGRAYVSASDYWLGVRPTAEPPGEQLVWSSADDGASFAPPVAVGAAMRERFGSVFADPREPARVLVASAEAEDESRVLLVESRDGGATWGEPLAVSPERDGRQLHPTGWVDGSGRARVSYYDSGLGEGERLVVSIVEDGRVVHEAVPESAPANPGAYRREYMGLSGVDDTSWAAWVAGDEASETWIEVAAVHG